MKKYKLFVFSIFILIISLLIYLNVPASSNWISSLFKTEGRNPIPELYPGVEWVEQKQATLYFAPRTAKGMVENEGYIYRSKPLADFPDDLVKHYRKELRAKGWTEINVVKGPGAITYHYSNGLNFLQLHGEFYLSKVFESEEYFQFSVKFPDEKVYEGYTVIVKHSIID